MRRCPATDEILRDAVEKRGGHVVKTTGERLHAAFALAPDGVAAALDAQRALVAEEWILPEPLKVRMGLHTGGAERRHHREGTATSRTSADPPLGFDVLRRPEHVRAVADVRTSSG